MRHVRDLADVNLHGLDEGVNRGAFGDVQPRDGIARDLGEKKNRTDRYLNGRVFRRCIDVHGGNNTAQDVVKAESYWRS